MPNVVIGEKREGDARIRSSGGIPTIEETYVFLVRAENKDISRFEVLRTPGLPVVNQSLSSYGLTVCRTKDATRREEHPELWDVTCEFSSEVEEGQDGGQSGEDNQTDPETWVPVYETKFERYQEVVLKDLSGTTVANSAGIGFPAGLTITRKHPVWEFFQIESANVSDEVIVDRSEVINSVVFKGRAVRTLKLDVLSSVRGFYYGAPRRLTHYSHTYNKRNWKHKRLDIGTEYLAAGKLEPFLNEKGGEYYGALDGSGGQQLPLGTPPAVREFDMFTEVDFHSFLRT